MTNKQISAKLAAYLAGAYSWDKRVNGKMSFETAEARMFSFYLDFLVDGLGGMRALPDYSNREV